MSRTTLAAVATILVTVYPASTWAHAVLATADATQNSFYKGVVEIDHGCKGAATRAIHVSIPEGFIAAKPMPKAGWTLVIETGPYAKSYPFRGSTLAEGAKTLTWQGDLPAEDYDEFVFQGFVTYAVPAGSTLYFPVVQECTTGAYHWTETPKEADASAVLPHPAPGVRIVAAAAPQSNAVSIVGQLRVSQPWARASVGDAPSSEGYVTIENRGGKPDRLAGATSDVAGAVTIVDARGSGDPEQEQGAVAGGLTIAPGERLEMRPGAYHLTLNALKAPLREGTQVQVTLTFDKAGPVTISIPVEDSKALSTGTARPEEDAPDRM